MPIFATSRFCLVALEILKLGWMCRWLDAARYGKLHSMKGLLKASGKHKAELVAYSGAGTSYGLMGHTALHWAAAKVCITMTIDSAFLSFSILKLPPTSPPPSPHPPTSLSFSTSRQLHLCWQQAPVSAACQLDSIIR